MNQQPPPVPSTPTPAAPPAPPPPRRSPWGWIFGILFAGTGAVVLLFIIFIIVSVGAAMRESGGMASNARNVHEQIVREGGRDKIAHIDLEGVISASANRGGRSMVEEFSRRLNAAVEDERVRGIVVRINSPGGEVTASDRLHHMLRRADARKPVVAYMDTIAASGGYYAACGSRHLMAHPTTLTGSIGVIMQSIKYGEMLDKLGLDFEIYKSGEMKDLLSGTRETRPDEIELVNELVGETYDRFLSIVAENRGKSLTELRGSPFTDGRIFSGRQGLDGGFIDSNGFIDDAYAKAAELAGVTDPTVVRYRTRQGLFDLFDPLAQAGAGKVEIDVSERLLPHLRSGVPLYLYPDAL